TEWPALVDLDVWQAAQALLKAPERRWPSASRLFLSVGSRWSLCGCPAPSGRWRSWSRLLLSGVARCAVCDAPIQSGGTRNGRSRYRCARMGGHAYREAAPADEYISEVVIPRLARA